MLLLFKALIVLHVAAGATGLVSFWVPILARKGGRLHRVWGKIFAYALLAAGGLAVAMSVMTIVAPFETHPHLRGGPLDATTIRALFGWLMLFLGTLTTSMAWFGLGCIWHKRQHDNHRHAGNVALQLAVPATALLCAVQGWRSGQMLMVGVAAVGVVSCYVNLSFMLAKAPVPKAYLQQHFRALIGAGISVYTAFLAFGAVQLMPSHAFNPVMWSVPSIVGFTLVVFHNRRIEPAERRRPGPDVMW